jgi:DNA-binding transcriptional LysR family regulator
VLEWLLLPRPGALRERLPETDFEIRSQRTSSIISELVEMTIDIGIVRSDSVAPP